MNLFGNIFLVLISLSTTLSFSQSIDTNMHYNIAQEQSEEPIFEEVSDDWSANKPTFIGGDDSLKSFISENLSYPPVAIENDIQGTVLLSFIVTKTGTIENVVTKNNPIGGGIEEEAIRVIKLTSGMWNPAVIKKQPVGFRYYLPLSFSVF